MKISMNTQHQNFGYKITNKARKQMYQDISPSEIKQFVPALLLAGNDNVLLDYNKGRYWLSLPNYRTRPFWVTPIALSGLIERGKLQTEYKELIDHALYLSIAHGCFSQTAQRLIKDFPDEAYHIQDILSDPTLEQTSQQIYQKKHPILSKIKSWFGK